MHSAPPLDGAGLLQVLVFVPVVPQAVALQAPTSPHPPSIPQAAIAGQLFVVATPQESVQVDIVVAAVPQRIEQSGLQVFTPEATHKLMAETVHAVDPDQQTVGDVLSVFLHSPSTGSHVNPDTQPLVPHVTHSLAPGHQPSAGSGSLHGCGTASRHASLALHSDFSAALGKLSGAVGAIGRSWLTLDEI